MKTYNQTLIWYDASEQKPKSDMHVLVTFGTGDEFVVNIGYWDEQNQAWYYANNDKMCSQADDPGVPACYIWSWAHIPKGIKFT